MVLYNCDYTILNIDYNIYKEDMFMFSSEIQMLYHMSSSISWENMSNSKVKKFTFQIDGTT